MASLHPLCCPCGPCPQPWIFRRLLVVVLCLVPFYRSETEATGAWVSCHLQPVGGGIPDSPGLRAEEEGEELERPVRHRL